MAAHRLGKGHLAHFRQLQTLKDGLDVGCRCPGAWGAAAAIGLGTQDIHMGFQVGQGDLHRQQPCAHHRQTENPADQRG